MRIICGCTSYWNSIAEFEARYNGVWIQEIDPRTGNVQHTLNPAYNGRFGLHTWREQMLRLFKPQQLVIACGTWSPPEFCSVPDVTVINGGAELDRPHTNGWQYMGCALTSLMAYVCNRRDWDVLLLLEPDVLLGAVDWPAVLGEFLNRPEEVFGVRWYDRFCDFIGWKRAAAIRYLHQRIRPNLSEDESLMWLDDELHQMFSGRSWNPWPEVKNTRQDHFHEASPRVPNEEAMRLPMIRMPDPAIVEAYDRECSSLAKAM